MVKSTYGCKGGRRLLFGQGNSVFIKEKPENFKTDVHGNHAWVDMRLTDRRADVQLYVSNGPGLRADQEHYGLLLGRHLTLTVPLSILGLNGYQ